MIRNWSCDHPRTATNTLASGYCRRCYNAKRVAERKTDEGYAKYARKRLETQIASARRRLTTYEEQARRLGMEHLI